MNRQYVNLMATLIVFVVGVGLGYGVYSLVLEISTNSIPVQIVQDRDSDLIISMQSSGFEPHNVDLQMGETICWINRDVDAHWPASNIHPTHGIYPEFDPKRPIAAGQEWCMTFVRQGIWTFHDHLHPDNSGIIRVN
jgi:plastocyanin